MDTETTTLLNTLTELYSARDLLMIQKREAIEAATPAEVKQAIADIEAESADKEAAITEKIAALETEVKAAVLEGGETVNGAYLQAVYIKGRTSWVSEVLEGMMALIPEIGQARRFGAPSVQIRIRKVQG